MMKSEDEVITKIGKSGIPAGTFGIVESVCSEGVWVDVYLPADADVPEDTVLYAENELELQ